VDGRQPASGHDGPRGALPRQLLSLGSNSTLTLLCARSYSPTSQSLGVREGGPARVTSLPAQTLPGGTFARFYSPSPQVLALATSVGARVRVRACRLPLLRWHVASVNERHHHA
jgi:hypothetical protein